MTSVRRLIHVSIFAILGSLVLLPSPAAAQTFGVRAGASVEPDQFFFGGHFETPPIAERVTFRPNLEIGLGNEFTLIAMNFELVYKFSTSKPWGVYAGGGPSLNLFQTDADDHAEGGFNILVGAEHRGGLFGELKAGAIDSPNLKIIVGYTIH